MVSNIFIFIPTWGNDPIWRAYFSKGLVQPPTSLPIGWIYITDPTLLGGTIETAIDVVGIFLEKGKKMWDSPTNWKKRRMCFFLSPKEIFFLWDDGFFFLKVGEMSKLSFTWNLLVNGFVRCVVSKSLGHVYPWNWKETLVQFDLSIMCHSWQRENTIYIHLFTWM